MYHSYDIEKVGNTWLDKSLWQQKMLFYGMYDCVANLNLRIRYLVWSQPSIAYKGLDIIGLNGNISEIQSSRFHVLLKKWLSEVFSRVISDRKWPRAAVYTKQLEYASLMKSSVQKTIKHLAKVNLQ